MAARDDLETVEQRLGLLPPMRLDHADDNVVAVLASRLRLLQHFVGLADAGRGADENLELAARLSSRRAASSSASAKAGMCRSGRWSAIPPSVSSTSILAAVT